MLKTHTTLLLCFLCITLSFAQKTKFKTGKTNSKNYYSIIRYKDAKGKIIIPVTIQNRTYQFLFDTGAPNVISSKILKKVKYSSENALTISDANNKKQNMNLTTIKSITVGDITFNNTSALIFEKDENILFDCFEIHGIIGSNLLQKSVVQINSQTKELILTNSIKNLTINNQPPTKLQIVGDQGSPYIKIQLKGKSTVSETLLFDTGASGFYDMSKDRLSLFKAHSIATSILSGEGASGIGIFGASEINTKYRLNIPEVTINNHTFSNIITTTTDDNHSRIGSDIFKYGVVTIDFKKKKFYFDGFKKTHNLREKQLGFSPIIKNNKLIVGVVWDEQLQHKISYGDEIIKVNTVDLAKSNLCDLIAKESPFKSSDVLEITLKNKDNQIHTYTLKRLFQQ